MSNGSAESRYLCLIPYLREKAFSFSSLSMMLAVGFLYMAFIMWRYISFITNLLKFLSWKYVEREVHILGIPPNCGVTTSGVGSRVRLCLCLSYPSLRFSFVFCYRGTVHLILSSFSEVIIPYKDISLLCLWEEVNPESSYAIILNSPSNNYYFKP